MGRFKTCCCDIFSNNRTRITLTVLPQRGISSPLKRGKMKALLNKFRRHNAAIALCLVIMLGGVYAQQVCCNTGDIFCTPKSGMIPGAYTVAASPADTQTHYRFSQAQLNPCARELLTDRGAGVTCCATDRCGVANPTRLFGTTFVQGNCPIQRTLCLDELYDDAQNSLEPANPSITRKSVPIHILTQSIIC